MDVIYIKVTVF